jgi:hypothetical protein
VLFSLEANDLFFQKKIYHKYLPNKKYNIKDNQLMVSFLMAISKKQLHNG